MIKKNKSLNLFDLLFYIIYVTHIHHISWELITLYNVNTVLLFVSNKTYLLNWSIMKKAEKSISKTNEAYLRKIVLEYQNI